MQKPSSSELDADHENLLRKSRESRTLRPVNTKKVLKTLRSRRNTMLSRVHDGEEESEEEKCSCCGKDDQSIQHYNSVFSFEGSLLCDSCYNYELCPGCGWEAGGLCRYCRS